MREWGLVYGMTLMLCRLQDPLETMESVSERALREARTAWLDYSGEFEPVERQRHSDIFDVLDAWQACQQDARRFGEPELKVTDRLKYTLDGLAEATDGRES